MKKILSASLLGSSHRNSAAWKLRNQNNGRQARIVCVGISALLASMWLASPSLAASYVQHNLVSDIPGMADFTDPDLINPWGIAFGPTTPFWISDNHTGLSTLYSGTGVKQALVVTIPPPLGGTPPGAPTGVVFNSGASAGTFLGDRFIFATEGGTINGWQPSVGTTAVPRVDNSPSSAVYKGLAIAASSLYAANFHSAAIDVFDANYTPVVLPGGFLDPTLPVGYAPFNIQEINGTLFVTYALQDAAKQDDVPGAGHGFIDEFSTSGVLIRRFASMGPLNSPWGLALAPASFGSFGGDLLVGNFGDGHINAYDLTTGAFVGSLTDASNNPITIPGLWGLRFGNNGLGFDTNKLYFTAGIPGGPGGQLEEHGLFGSISAGVPDSGATLILLIVGLAGLLAFDRAMRWLGRASAA